MGKKPTGKKTGRPKIPMITDDIEELEGKLPSKKIHLKTVLYWMDLGATQEEIAGAHYVSVDTLSRRLKEHTGLGFAELKEKCCGGAKVKLRQNQFKLTEKNATMGIWLGKQWLNQKDLPEVFEKFNGKLASLLDLLMLLQPQVKEIKEEGK